MMELSLAPRAGGHILENRRRGATQCRPRCCGARRGVSPEGRKAYKEAFRWLAAERELSSFSTTVWAWRSRPPAPWGLRVVLQQAQTCVRKSRLSSMQVTGAVSPHRMGLVWSWKKLICTQPLLRCGCKTSCAGRVALPADGLPGRDIRARLQ